MQSFDAKTADAAARSDDNAGYTILIGQGTNGIGSRLVGAVPRKLSATDVRRCRETLAAGYVIEIRTASRAAWVSMRGNLFLQLGLVA